MQETNLRWTYMLERRLSGTLSKMAVLKDFLVNRTIFDIFTARKIKFFIKDFFSKCGQIRRKLGTWSHLMKKSLMENFTLCAVDSYLFMCKIRDGASYIFTN